MEPAPAPDAPADGDAPAAHIDKLQLGLSMVLPVRWDGVARFARALARARLVRTRAVPDRPHRLELEVSARATPGAAGLKGRLVLVPGPAGQVSVSPASQLRPDVMAALRAHLGCRIVAFDGQLNVAAPFGPDAPAHLGFQLGAARGAVDGFLARLAAAGRFSGGIVDGRVWVQQAEFCRDLPMAEPREVIRLLGRLPLAGAAARRDRVWVERRANAQTVTWAGRAETSPHLKAYAKAAGLLRCEVQLLSRDAVVAVIGTRMDAELSGDGVASALAALAAAAAPMLDDIAGEMDLALFAEPASGADFVLALAPLIRAAAPALRPPGAPGRPPSAVARREAELALRGLISEGAWDMARVRAEHPALLAMREMRQAGVLRAAAGTPRLFLVHPRFQRARAALAAAQYEPDVEGEADGEG